MKKKPRHLRVAPDLPEVVEIDNLTDADVRAAFIVRFGPACAAWLCNRFRRHARKLGTFLVHIPENKPLPSWFDIAVNYLEKHRTKRWAVQRTTSRGMRYFRVFYLPKRAPLPTAIVPVGQS